MALTVRHKFINRIKTVASLLLCANLGALAGAQVGWSVSETVTVPRTDFSVTGPPPYQCLNPAEKARLGRNPVHRFQVWANRQLEERWDWTGRLQTYDNCAEACAVVPLEAQAIVELQSFVYEAPDNRSYQSPWPRGGNYSVWDEQVDSSTVRGGERRVCATFHNWRNDGDVNGYFIVYFSY